MKLLFMRHGESEANVRHILASIEDFELTEQGREDVALIAEELTDHFSVTKIISSPLLRACQTAEAFQKKSGIPIESDDRLSEQHLGKFVGKTYAEAEADPLYMRDRSKRWEWVPPAGERGEGESYKMIADRIGRFLADLEKEELESATVLIVTHAVAMRLVWSVLKNEVPCYPERIPNNGEVWEVDFSGVGSSSSITKHFFGESEKRVHQA